MPALPVNIDSGILVIASVTMSFIVFGFGMSSGLNLGISLVVAILVGLVLYNLEVIPIGFLIFTSFFMILLIIKMIFLRFFKK